jgi:4-amino-4-deoxy-L-arabinose transferase-like glycosyltransferase
MMTTATRTASATIIIASLFLCATLAWCLLDRTPPSWDDAYYLTKSLDLYDTLTDKGVVKYAARFLTVMDAKPPLIAALPTPVYLVTGRKFRAAYAVNLLFLAIMFAAIYGIARHYASSRAGLIAVAVAGTMPVIYSLSHWYLVECGLVALVCLFIYLLIGWSDSSPDSSSAGRAMVLGIVFGLGMLMKASFAVYVAIPLAYVALHNRSTALRSRSMLWFVITSASLAAPWYLVNARHVIGTALHAGSAETAKVYQTGAAASISAMAGYLFNVAHDAPWLYLAASAALAALVGPSLPRQMKQGFLLALLWISPLIFLTASHYRDIRYAAPLYPAAALMFAWLADAAIRKHGAIATIGIVTLLSLGTLSMLQNSFGSYDKTLQMGGLLLDQHRLYYARAYDRSTWPQAEILKNIDGKKGSILLGTNSITFNVDNFTLAAVQQRLALDIETTAYITDASVAAEAMSRAAYFVYEDGGVPDQPNFNTFKEFAVKQARDSGRFVELLSRPLPDGGIARVFAAKQSSPEELPTCKVTFADQLQLIGISASRIALGIEVKYKWLRLKPLDRDYWCFTHVVDAKGNVVGYLDHRLNDAAIETRVFRLPDGDSGTYELRVGIYHPQSGDRLPITESMFPLTQKNTAAVIPVTAK